MNYLIAQPSNTKVPPKNTPPKTLPANKANSNAAANKPAPTTTTGQVVVPPIDNPTGVSSLSGVVYKVISVMLALIIIAAVIVIIISGFKMMTGGGSPDQLKSAKKGILWAVIGLVVAFMSFAIVAIIQRLLV